MPTGQALKEDQDFVESQGFSLAILDKPSAKATWYRPDGKAIPNLPVDGYSRDLYRRKGWTLQPPAPITLKEPVEGSLKLMPTEGEWAEGYGIPQAPPPKHFHVMQPEIGSPCLVQGCSVIRKRRKGAFDAELKIKRNKRKVKETANAI